jgi:hypothetical protein
MSKTIEFSDHDYARIQDAAAAEGKPLGAWVVENLPLESEAAPFPVAPPCANGKPARTMADVLAGRVGLIDSGDGRLSAHHSEIFGEILEEKRREGRL